MMVATEMTGARRGGRVIPVLFTATIFTSALLLFFVQPLFTRLVLPQIGGAAAVWTTAMLFFQTVLIGGYLYAHVLTRHVPMLAQVAVHLALLLLALAFLPLAVPEGWHYDPARPVVTQTLMLYALGVGLPFAVLSANAPLIQSWYRRSGAPGAEDPYFLYAASNLGSLVALLAFPFVAEPLFGVTAISAGWSLGFLALEPLLLMSGLAARRGVEPAAAAAQADREAPALGLRTLAWWAFLAFLPSSLMLCVTTKISTDLGTMPLVWVIPLALYLLTFVLVFSTRSALTADRLRRGLPVALAVLVLFAMLPLKSFKLIGLLLLAFFLIALAAHRILFEARPDPRQLTVFYLTMSVGGALGGLFNSIFAPAVFHSVMEYPITVMLCALLMLRRPQDLGPRNIAAGLLVGVVALLPILLDVAPLRDLTAAVKVGTVAVLLGAALVVLARRPATGIAAICVVLAMWMMINSANILNLRSFFGVHLVKEINGMRLYTNGNTVHGAQLIAETEGRPTPLTYYDRRGLMAQIVSDARKVPARSVGVVGLGIGALACYAQPGQDWHFYEIDPTVVEIAQDSRYFRFLSACAPDAKIHVGDARIVLQQQTDQKFDILVIDAYSSDAIPVHLATVEAIQLYLDRLNPGGILVFHISNRFYDLGKALVVAADHLGLASRVAAQSAADLKDVPGAYPSRVVVLARNEDDLGIAGTDPAWKPLPPSDIRMWTDDYANLLAVLR